MRGRGFLFFLLYCLLDLIDQYALIVNGNSVIYLYYILFYLLYFILFYLVCFSFYSFAQIEMSMLLLLKDFLLLL